MGMWDRLGSVLKSYLNDINTEIPRGGQNRGARADPDLDAAFDELNDYLKGKERQERPEAEYSGKPPPEELRADFSELGIPFGAGGEECKAAYKKLLKIHHPDRHAGHADNFKKATDRTARINAAWDRIEKWRKSENQ